ncbi:TB2/DP1, HVA22 family-domain-containing protein [Zychaea mexicana]|uniref:TB2/DP1, HVA22 family-domain-containing protein n=1 Tax=Zychaea mexicana TaxID=64656 RepID=UPI0022FEAB64|nr:TB2/DP1, HVA22 family-domain-containing protein [Zychaea mexicana]KAI9491431.1 TB2/DP1, HVA22 family-domain-containing protein [Zychaea mexicana]
MTESYHSYHDHDHPYNNNNNAGVDFRLHATSSAIERFLESLNRQSPINLEFLTRPFGKASISRVHSLETIYAQSRLFRFLVRKGVNPILLFVSLTAGIAGGVRRFYKQSTRLALNLVGVVYPAWQCWRLVKEQQQQQEEEVEEQATHGSSSSSSAVEREREYKSWLTYWIIYGTFQVLDNWTSDILSLFPNYNVYKLALLYWLQSPHSKGASLLCHQVIQKPNYPASAPPYTPTASYSIPSSPESHHAEDVVLHEHQHHDDDDDDHHHHHPLTLTIEQPAKSTTTTSILDGYTPTLQRQEPSVITEKQQEQYPLLEAEAAW